MPGWADLAVADNGTILMCSCTSESPEVSLGGMTVVLPEPAREIKACWAYGHTYAVVHGQLSDPGKCYVVRDDGLIASDGPIACENGVAILPWNGKILVVFITDRARYVKWFLTPDLVTSGKAWYDQPSAVFPGTSQGIRDLDASGTPLLIDLEPTITLPNGETLFLWMQRGQWIVGQSSNALAQVSAWDGTKMFTVWKGNTSHPPRLAVSPSGQVIAGIASAEPLFIHAPFGDFETAPVVRPAIVAIDRPFGLGWITFAGPTDAPHNCDLRVADPMYLTADDGTKLARYVSAPNDSDVDALEQAIRDVKTKEPSMPVLAYWTRQAQAIRLPAGADIVGVEAYRGVDEPIESFEFRVNAAVKRCHRAALIMQCYTSNTKNHPDLAALVPVYARVSKARLNLERAVGFSAGPGRKTGWDDQPADVHDSYRALFKGIPSAPVIVKPVPKPDPIPDPIPVPQPPIPAPVPSPAPSEETDMPVQVGQKGAYRPWGSSIQPMRATVQGHQDAGYLSIQKPSGKFTNFPSGEDRDTAGIGERVTFDGRVMIAQPSDPNTGEIYIYEWFSL